MQTEATLRLRAAAARSQETSAPSSSASSAASPPATIRVSIGPRQSASVECISTRTPLEVRSAGSTATSSML